MCRVSSPTLVLAALLLCGLCSRLPAQSDLVVHSTEPGAYRTLQDALDAAMPGDRILIGEDIQGYATIRKSVTIQSRGPGRYRSWSSGTFGWTRAADLEIEALTPGIPLVIRRLDIDFYEMSRAGTSLGTGAYVPGEIRIDDVSFSYGVPYGNGYGGKPMIDVQADRVWIRSCSFKAEDMRSSLGCIDVNGTAGVDCVHVDASLLCIEDCTLRAGSATFLMPHSTGCFGGSGIWPYGGPGGAALVADTGTTLLTRVRLSEGNGGSLMSGNWFGRTLYPGPAGASQLVGPGGRILAYDTLHQQGKDGVVTSSPTPDPTRGPTLQVGRIVAPLRLGGDATPGGFLRAEVDWFAHAGAVLGMSLDWGPSSTVAGPSAISFPRLQVLEPVHPPATKDWSIPASPQLVGLPLTGQLFSLQSGAWQVENFSGVWIGR